MNSCFWRLSKEISSGIVSQIQLLSITASQYDGSMYTVIPKDLLTSSGILPEDQKFSDNYVILWDSYRDLLTFDESVWKKVKIQIPQHARYRELNRVGNGFALPYIPNQWQIEEITSIPIYSE
jgi:hypothetical protein